MLFRHWVLLFYECIIATLFVHLTFDDPYDIWLTNVKEKTIATNTCIACTNTCIACIATNTCKEGHYFDCACHSL